MSKFMFYLHRRLFVQEYGRAEMLDILARKTLKSFARSTGTRLATNRWARTFEFLYRSTGIRNDYLPPEIPKFYQDFTAAMSKYQRTHAVSIGRVDLILRYLEAKSQADYRTLFPIVLNDLHHKFNERGDTVWFFEATGKMRFRRAEGCRHYHYDADTRYLRGTAEDMDHVSEVCPTCATTAAQSGERLPDYRGSLILSEFAVEVRTSGQSRVQDRRTPGLTWNEQRQFWHTADWSPWVNIIDNYHTAKAVGFKVIESPWLKRHRRAFGLELEVQNRSDASSNMKAGKIHEILNPSGNKGEYCFFERDGSIGEGFEIVTQPAGLDIHKEKLDLFLNNEDLKRGLRSHEGGSCGLHVHVGKQYLTQAQIYRVQSFLNDVRNEGLIKKISRRYGNSYARIRPEMAKLSPMGKNTGERYEALNVTNRHTVEFRIFRGSLKYESVIAALEFVDALLTFCMPGQTSIMDFNAIGFRKFITRPENSPDTKFLRAYLQLNQQNDAEHRLAA